MKARNLLISFLTVLCVCWGSVALGNTPETQTTEAQVTVNINEVDAENLAEVLDGIGLSRAEAIVQYRTENGRFYSAEGLSAVRGIEMATVAKNESKIIIK
jgi:competence protein ComEA